MSTAVLTPTTTSTTPQPKGKPAIASIPTPAPKPYRYSITEYRKQGAAGAYGDHKTMLINGEVYILAQPAPPHNLSLGKTDDLLRTIFTTGFHIRNQMALDVGTKSDPSPDLAVVPGSREDYATRQATTAVLVVEVSDSSLFMDSTTKAELYATAQVPEYWVIDLENRRVLVFRDPVSLPAGLGATAYRSHSTYDPNESFSPLAVPHAVIRVSDLLPFE